jgi:DASS family divalent anion:Na+ symporter
MSVLTPESAAATVAPPEAILAPPARGQHTPVNILRLLIAIAPGVVIALLPVPAGVEPRAWHLLAVFVSTIVGIVARPLPMGAVALIAMTFAVLAGILPIADAAAGFGNPTVWLIVSAFFIATAFTRTGLGLRIAYHFLRLLGRRTLGLAYGLVATDLMLSPAIPSNTARAGGVVFPILRSLGLTLGSDVSLGTERRVSAFLTVTAYQGAVITSAMFLTAMVANPLSMEFASQQGVHITWGMWALAASVPGFLSLFLVPLIIFYVYPPEVKDTPEAPLLAQLRLEEMGPVARNEKILLATIVALLVLWGAPLGVNATTTALAGVGVLLLTGALGWDDLLDARTAWDAFVWFSILVMMAGQLGELGLIKWFSAEVGGLMQGIHWVPAFLGLALVYFYSHYFFASNTAHVAAMYSPFLAVALAAGAPPVLAALVLAFFSNLFAGLTHYGTAPGPIFFGSGNVKIGAWWKLGALISVVNIVIWLGIGSLWWKVLGYW